LIDIHSHVLPGLDDGAADEKTALEMCRMAAEAGTTDLVATPHNNVRYPYDREAVEQKLAALRAELGDSIYLHRGCDMHLTSTNVREAIEDPTRYTINGLRYLLVEFSDEILVQGARHVLTELRAADIIPIVTHPERNPRLRKDMQRLKHWFESGGMFQVTAQSLLGRFGERSQESAFLMMDANLVHFIASDAHDTSHRTPRLIEAFEFVAYRWGEHRAERLLIDNPWATLWGQDIEPPPPRVKKRWTLFASPH
jgi:protein-tyrosine phosphatase